MANIIITSIRRDGEDIVFNDSFSVPKDKITINKREEDFVTVHFDQQYYSDVSKRNQNFLDIHWQDVTDPANVDSNDELFEKLVNMKCGGLQ